MLSDFGGGIVLNVARVALALVNVAKYPLVALPLRDVLYEAFLKAGGAGEGGFQWREIAIAVGMNLIVAVAAGN